ncbi:MAG: putative toxin-antitoxin system toxin component, PIN family [Candidatus Handelsmanbacteria bacterium RIFCSPLOWO2_12_FULL_64_10]|uniref:Putative toxin-antitoxin system toxin component, PIN family n=1 Tax=Handelsmanbacteria sp. (strain RIFCSPLOWO2_12_FULL_64_10) TaxID=1817868 RepID=A0A1F6C545_HANXR|nr:MAG: putative toxin-antitoxin system toxin component, PIN family [Candidatus Handelsmanbacteria bacterium RIFCSPLOWO2_12_FULL_64_10]
MLRIAPDVNVLVSAVLRPPGPPGRIVAAWRRGEIELITSPTLIERTADVLRRPHILNNFPIDEADIQDLRTLLEEETLLTPHALDLRVVEEDPEDDAIIIAAVEGRADCIISGDRHLKNLGTHEGIPILSPGEFVAQYNIP